MNQTSPARSERALERREQILDAASQCFGRKGFHGASIAAISKACGMSVGHIYHFFENKEAIVTAIVERRVQQWIALLESLDARGEILEPTRETALLGITERTTPEFNALWLEILAEAARNPQIADAVRTSEKRLREKLTHLIAAAREEQGLDEAAPAEAIIELICAFYEGVSNRVVINPEFDWRAAADLVATASRTILRT